ncbi:MAG: protein kinase, partial [bacterium]
MIGQTISHYRITRELGSGGMGIVFEAEDLKLNRHVALKLMLREAVSEEHRKRFIREAQAASALNHPNITTIYDFLELDSGDVIVMEYVAGVTLREKIANGPLSIEQVVRIGIEACNALAEAHAKGIVHRDIKPENLMLSDKEKLKITDFGCVKLLDLATAEKTQEGALLGTLCYMSPEQLQGEVVDGRSDLFSLGAVLYELLTGCFPFRGEYSTAIAYSIVHENPSPLHELRPEIPPALENLIFKALAKDVQERYQTAFEMEADLRSIQSSVLEIPKLRKIQFSSPLLKRVTMTLVSLLVIALTVSLVFLLGPSKDGCHGITSIAVMPFELSEVEENWNWLGKGIADLLNTELTHGSTMRVLSAQQ